jgi:hypothetical protein
VIGEVPPVPTTGEKEVAAW